MTIKMANPSRVKFCLQKYNTNRCLVNHKLKVLIRRCSIDTLICLFCYEPEQLCSSLPTLSLWIRQPALSRNPTTLPYLIIIIIIIIMVIFKCYFSGELIALS